MTNNWLRVEPSVSEMYSTQILGFMLSVVLLPDGWKWSAARDGVRISSDALESTPQAAKEAALLAFLRHINGPALEAVN